MGYSVSLNFANMNRIQHDNGAIRENIRKTGIFPKRPTFDVVRNIRNMIKHLNQRTQREMTSKCGVPLSTVNRILSQYLKENLRK